MKRKISDLAGSWEASDEEVQKTILNAILKKFRVLK